MKQIFISRYKSSTVSSISIQHSTINLPEQKKNHLEYQNHISMEIWISGIPGTPHFQGFSAKLVARRQYDNIAYF